METTTRPQPTDGRPARERRDRLVLSAAADRPLMVSWARIKYERRVARRAALRRAWRVGVAMIVGVSAGIAMYSLAAAGVLPLLEGGSPEPVVTAPAP